MNGLMDGWICGDMDRVDGCWARDATNCKLRIENLGLKRRVTTGSKVRGVPWVIAPVTRLDKSGAVGISRGTRVWKPAKQQIWKSALLRRSDGEGAQQLRNEN
jgi:hypothetical protein